VSGPAFRFSEAPAFNVRFARKDIRGKVGARGTQQSVGLGAKGAPLGNVSAGKSAVYFHPGVGAIKVILDSPAIAVLRMAASRLSRSRTGCSRNRAPATRNSFRRDAPVD
jgi:hypothetical protein